MLTRKSKAHFKLKPVCKCTLHTVKESFVHDLQHRKVSKKEVAVLINKGLFTSKRRYVCEDCLVRYAKEDGKENSGKDDETEHELMVEGEEDKEMEDEEGEDGDSEDEDKEEDEEEEDEDEDGDVDSEDGEEDEDSENEAGREGDLENDDREEGEMEI